MYLSPRNILLVTLFLILTANPGLAQQTTAKFAGIVQDSSGAVLPGVEASLINEGTSAALQSLTNETGEFLFDFVPPGTYTLKLTLSGFKGFESRGIPLGAAQSVRRTYTLEVGAVTDSVTVTGEAPLVNTLSPEQRLTLDTLQVTNLPMINRNVTAIIEYSGAGLTKGEALVSGAGGVRFRMNGLGGSAMTATANGTNASGFAASNLLGGYGGFTKIDIMSADAVGEVQVVKGVIPAQYGGLSGNVSFITKSGTNDWHGSLFHRYEGSALSAHQPFLSTKPHSVWNQFGGSLGGPILRDKFFFFFAYEGYRQRSTTTLSNDVPTPLFRDTLRRALPFVETDINLKYYTLPNQPYGPNDLLARWVGPGLSNQDDDHVDTKLDYLIGGGNLSVTFSGAHPSQDQAAQQPLNPRTFRGKMLRGNASYVIGRSRWTSATYFGVNASPGQRIEKFFNERDPAKAETPGGVGRGVPAIMFTGMTAIAQRERKQWGVTPSYHIEQQMSLFHGAHSWKFGGKLDLRRGGAPDSTNAGVTFQNLTDVMLNTPQSVGLNMQQSEFYRWTMNGWSFYGQDDWRLSRKLVMNLGLRYDRFGAFIATGKPPEDLTAIYNPDGLLDSVNFLWAPLRDPKQPFQNDNFNFAPRVGFAYTADSKGDFAVRGGFGINFAGFDGSSFETAPNRAPGLPVSVTFSRAESASYRLKFPAYNEDMVGIVLAQNRSAQASTRINPNFQSPYAMNYSLEIQRALTPSLMIETGYVGSRGVKFNLSRTFNLVDRATGNRPNPNDIQGTYLDNSQQTNYNSWQTSIKQRFTHGLAINGHYTWGKALAYSGGDVGANYLGDSRVLGEDFNNVRIERSLASGDVTHNLSVDWFYQAPTPFANSSIARGVLGGWNIAGIWRARTGQPLGVTQTGGRPDLLDVNGAVNTTCCSFGNLQYLNPAAFSLLTVPASGRTIRRGTAGATALRGPGIWNVDLALGKNFTLNEDLKLELKADMLNALNHTQYTGVQSNLSGVRPGEITSAAVARVIQVQLRLAF
jgi:carboxypeptidase family protein